MFARNGVKVAFLFLCSVMAGCATSRSEIKLNSPTAMPPSAIVSSGPTAVIRSVTDERIFEQAPHNPSTPSLGFEGATQASAELKARAIGRKRNGFGKALGDVLLESGQTVEGVIRENLTTALQQAGYQIKDEKTAGPSPLVIDVRIKEFWAWFQPGFWAITLNTNIATDLDLSGTASPTSISVHTEDKRQLATEGAWMEIVGKGLEDYRTQARNRAAAFPKNAKNDSGQ